MRIFMIHNAYKKYGGEDVVFKMEQQLLKSKGHEVFDYVVSNHEINTDSFFGKLKVAVETIWSYNQYKKIKKIISEVKPDIVHIHNTFPRLSPSCYWAIKSEKIPIVQTLHNFRISCANALLFKSNEPCQKCVKGNSLNALKYKCYRNSVAATIPLVLMQKLHKVLGTFKNKVDLYITLNNFNKEIMIKSGLPAEKIVVKPNFISNSDWNMSDRKKQITYVGRISKEKGLDLLLESYAMTQNSSYHLVIIGEGPEKDFLKEKYSNVKGVFWRGYLPHEEVIKEVKKSRVLVMPSRWYETFGMVIIEAFSTGTPVIGPNHAGIPEIITHGKNGLTFTPNSPISLNNAINKFLQMENYEWELMSRFARSTFEDYYTEDINYKFLMDIYNRALK